jgi:hypothetical protein
MPTDDKRLPPMPVLSWQRPPVTRNVNGRRRPGVSGNPRGRPTNARLAAKRAAGSYVAQLKRLASYDGLTGDYFVRLARIAYGRSWQKPLAADLGVSRQAVIRWAKDEYKISHACEMQILAVCLRRTRAAHAQVRTMVRRAAAGERAREELAAMLPAVDPLGATPGEI